MLRIHELRGIIDSNHDRAIDVIYTDCNNVRHRYNAEEIYRIDQYDIPWTNYWHMNEGEILVHLSYKSKNVHSLMIREWCWVQGWNKIDGGIRFRTVSDRRWSNRALAFIFYNEGNIKEAALIFKMRWG